LVTDGRLG